MHPFPLAVVGFLALLKAISTAASIGSGAAGGTLTPAPSIGESLGAFTGGIWLLLWPGSPIGAFALVGAAAFLRSIWRAPLTGLVLVLEFSQQGLGIIVPMALAVGSAAAVGYLLGRRQLTGTP